MNRQLILQILTDENGSPFAIHSDDDQMVALEITRTLIDYYNKGDYTLIQILMNALAGFMGSEKTGELQKDVLEKTATLADVYRNNYYNE